MVTFLQVLRQMRRRLADEHGGFMIEVMVSAALIVTAGGGVLMAMDTATQQSGEQRLQAVAADVAQAEMERLRSQKFEYLATLADDNDVTVGATVFKVVSSSAWAMQAPAGAVQCTNSARNPEALRITTMVTWPRMRRQPIRMSSLVAAPAGSAAQRGTYVVQITTRDGVGISGISVSMSGASPVAGTTDANGCVRFTELQPGPYTIAFAHAGYIDHAGATTISKPTSVVAGQTKSTPFEIDRAGSGSIALRFDGNGTSGSTTLTAPTALPKFVSVDNSLAMPAHRALTVGAVATLGTGNLYPFGGGYQVYADDCSNAIPPTPMSMLIDPGVQNKPFTLQLPVLDIRPRSAEVNDRVYVRTACGNVVGPRLLSSSGVLVEGFPYGLAGDGFAVCVVDASDGSWDRAAVSNTTYDTHQRVDDDTHGLDMRDSNPGAACNGWTLPS